MGWQMRAELRRHHPLKVKVEEGVENNVQKEHVKDGLERELICAERSEAHF
tara:strand:- start:364 stop:516 length:153 start_codon:yes stop_codon:yes gene_type:complete